MATPPARAPSLSHSFAAADDGTQLSYYSVGEGPNLLVLHGAVTYALTHKELALALSPYFTVHIASRRGRGLSGPYPSSVTSLEALDGNMNTTNNNPDPKATDKGKEIPNYERTYNPDFTAVVLATEAADLQTLLKATDSTFLLAVSSGALIALHYLDLLATTTIAKTATGTNTPLRKIILFEPPLIIPPSPTVHSSSVKSAKAVKSSVDITLLARYESERAANANANAMITAMRLVQLGPPACIPRWVVRTVAERVIFPAEEREVQSRRERRERREREKAGKGKEDRDGQEGVEGDNDSDDDRGVCTMLGLGEVLRYDFVVVEGMMVRMFMAVRQDGGDGDGEGERAAGGRGLMERLHAASVGERKRDILLLGGGKSPGYLKEALGHLREALPAAKTVVMDGVGHEVLCGKEMRGRPEVAVPAIREFFLGSSWGRGVSL